MAILRGGRWQFLGINNANEILASNAFRDRFS